MGLGAWGGLEPSFLTSDVDENRRAGARTLDARRRTEEARDMVTIPTTIVISNAAAC